MTQSTQAITDRQQYWLDHIRAADESEGSLVAYAAAHDLKVKHLYQWKTALARRGVWPVKANKPAFVPVKARSTSAPAMSCSISLPNGVRLQFGGELEGTWLRDLLSAASALP